DPGSKSHAEYHGGWTRSPRSNNRVAPNITAAAATAGAVRRIAQRVPPAPAAAPSSGWTPAIARAAGTAKPSRRSRGLALGKVRGSTDGHHRHLGRQREDRPGGDPSAFDVPIEIGPRQLRHERVVEGTASGR